MYCKETENKHTNMLNHKLDYEIEEKAIKPAILK